MYNFEKKLTKRNYSVLISALFIIISSSVQAQKTLGVRAGFQSSSFYKGGSMVPETNSYNSFYVGVFKEKKQHPYLISA